MGEYNVTRHISEIGVTIQRSEEYPVLQLEAPGLGRTNLRKETYPLTTFEICEFRYCTLSYCQRGYVR